MNYRKLAMTIGLMMFIGPAIYAVVKILWITGQLWNVLLAFAWVAVSLLLIAWSVCGDETNGRARRPPMPTRRPRK